jgi:hypothetical protein
MGIVRQVTFEFKNLGEFTFIFKIFDYETGSQMGSIDEKN